MAELRWNSRAGTVGRFGRSPLIKWGGPVVAVAGGVLGAADNYAAGDSAATAIIKATVETGFSVAVGAAGASLATAACGGFALCGVAGAVAGGWVGGKVGQGFNSLIEKTGFYKWTDSWFD